MHVCANEIFDLALSDAAERETSYKLHYLVATSYTACSYKQMGGLFSGGMAFSVAQVKT